jgi:hypothetical protein
MLANIEEPIELGPSAAAMAHHCWVLSAAELKLARHSTLAGMLINGISKYAL